MKMKRQATNRENVCKPHIHIKNSKNSTIKKQRIKLQNGQKTQTFHQRGYIDGT